MHEDSWRDSYDAWKTDAPDPGSGPPSVLVLTCRECDWRSKSSNAGEVFTTALAHVIATGHTLTYKGVPQDYSRYLQQERNQQAKAEAAQDKPIKRGVA